MAKFKVRLQAEGVDTYITVEASSQSNAKELAIEKFKQSYPAWKERKIMVVDVKEV